MHHHTTPLRIVALALALALALPAAVRPALAAVSFQSSAAITFTDPSASPPALPEAASPYPSTISVTGLKGSITKVTVGVTGLTHSFPDSIELLLVGPTGKQVLLMSDVGGNTAVNGLSLTFAAGAPAIPDDGPLTAGSYSPTKGRGSASFPAPAPALAPPAGNTALSTFNLTNPNGDWRLFAVEDTSATGGTIGGWSLTIETADLAADVSAAPASVNAGAPLAYTVTAHNYGTETVANPTLTIAIPTGTKFQSATPPAGWSCATPASGATSFTCTTAAFASGAAPAIAVSVLADKTLAPDSTITRGASITSTVAEADTANNSDTATTKATTLADLSVVSVDSPSTINAGARMTVAVRVQNSGPSNAADARVTIPVPDGTTFVSLSAAAGWSCTSPAVGAEGDVSCSSAVFTTATANFALVVKVNPALAAATTIDSAASITSDTPDGTPANNSGADTTTVGTATDIAVRVDSAPNPVSAAANLVYTIAVTNNGPSNAAAAALTTDVRSGTTFVALEAPAGWSCTSPAVGAIGPVSCANPSFGVTTATFRLTVQVLSGTPIGTLLQHSSSVSSTTADTSAANNTATESTEVTINADLALTLQGVGATVKSGTDLVYRLRVNNSGPEPAESVTLTTATPSNTTFVALQAPDGWSCTKPAVGAAGAISCTNAGLDVTTQELALTVRLGKVATGTAVVFSAAIQSPTGDASPANNSVSLSSKAVPPFRIFLPLMRR